MLLLETQLKHIANEYPALVAPSTRLFVARHTAHDEKCVSCHEPWRLFSVAVRMLVSVAAVAEYQLAVAVPASRSSLSYSSAACCGVCCVPASDRCLGCGALSR